MTPFAALFACCLFLNLMQVAVAIIASSTARLSSAFSLTHKVGREDIQMFVTPAATQTTGSCQLPKRMSDYNAFIICTAMISKRSLFCELPWSVLLSREELLWMTTCTRISERLSPAMTSASAILICQGHLLACSGRIRCVHLQ